MLARSHRFHGYGSLNAVYRRGETVRGPQLSLKYLRRNPNQQSRVAIVVSKKVSKSAVTRNRIRRRIYEVVRNYKPTVPGGYDLVFTAFGDDLAEQKAAQLQQNVAHLLEKALKQP